MAWGRFDPFIVAAVPARDLRAHLGINGAAARSAQDKAEILRRAIQERLAISGAR